MRWNKEGASGNSCRLSKSFYARSKPGLNKRGKKRNAKKKPWWVQALLWCCCAVLVLCLCCAVPVYPSIPNLPLVLTCTGFLLTRFGCAAGKAV